MLCFCRIDISCAIFLFIYIAFILTNVSGSSILYLADPNTFSSLTLLNSEWRLASKSTQLYVHQLSHCHNYLSGKMPIQGSFNEDDLPRLRQQFVLEVKRNLFDSYIRPKETVVKLIST